MAKFVFDWQRALNWKNISLSLLCSLAIATSLTIIISGAWGVTLPIGKAWIIVFITIFISYYFIAARDKRIDRSEIMTIIFLAGLFFVIGWIMKRFIPEIFSSFPDALKGLFSSIGVK
jgi:ABC-type maltose transport system permease subunit